MSLSTLRNMQDLPPQILLSLPVTQDEAVIRKQACRLLSVAKTVFACPVIDEQKVKIAQLQKTVVSLRSDIRECIVETIGRPALMDAIKLYANTYFGLTCYCRYCCEIFGAPAHRIQERKRCQIFPKLIETFRECDVTFGFVYYYKGNPCEGQPEIPADFPPEGSAFPPESLSHMDKHVVFERMGNAYEFKFGTPLHFVDSMHHPEGIKILRLIKRLHARAMEN